MAFFESKKVYMDKISSLNKVIEDLSKEEMQLKNNINEYEKDADLLQMLFFQLRRTITTRNYLEGERQTLMRKYLKLDSDDESESESESD